MNTKFVRLTDYCVLEYNMEPLNSTNYITNSFVKLDLGPDANSVFQIYNPDSDLGVTKNVKDLTVTDNGAQFVYLDSEVIPNYTDAKSLNETIVSGHTVVMDTVRYHFATGFDFDDFKGLIFNINQNLNDGTKGILSQLLISPETFLDIVTFNPKPLMLGDSMYDKYVEIRVPSLKNIDDEFANGGSPSSTFEYEITDGVGFVLNAPITVSMFESQYVSTINIAGTKYNAYEVDQTYSVSIAQINEFDELGLIIQESSQGDYIEFFATYAGGFPAEIIADLNNRSALADWMIIHQINVVEQVGSNFAKTASMSIYQEDSFDEPMIYRPVLKNANEALSVSLDYTMRLINRADGNQEIRTGSLSILNPNKYGRQLQKIQLANSPESQKIYNKVIQENYKATQLFVEPVNEIVVQEPITQIVTETVTKTEYVPLFVQTNEVHVAESNMNVKSAIQGDSTVFGQGKLPLVISPFVNFIKFKIYTKSNGELMPLNLNYGIELSLVFGTNKQIRFSNVMDASKENPSIGEIVFRIPKEDAVRILTLNESSFYITGKSSDGNETMIYSGTMYGAESIKEVIKIQNEVKTEIAATTPPVTTTPVTIPDLVPNTKGNQLTEGTVKPINTIRPLDIPGYVRAHSSIHDASSSFKNIIPTHILE